jgi:nucleotide-binding universal stress UspA family protein
MLGVPQRRTICTMSTIVVATDGSHAAASALDAAIELAHETGDRVCVITVWRALQGDFGLAYPPSAVLDDILATEREHAEETLREARERADAAGVEIETSLQTGDPPEQICAYADEVGARVIAVGSHGHGALMSLLVGSVSGAVISRANVPVLVVREGSRSQSAGDAEARRRSDAAPTG